MKYQSEIIAEIVDKRGHEKSSLHYESECIQSWIDENKGNYPKLCDYQSEWLNYINENHIGVFPYETLTDVTEATVNNVVPYSYKSAILSGQTLVNLSQINKFSISGSGTVIHSGITNLMKTNTTYTRILVITKNTLTGANSTNGVAHSIGNDNFSYYVDNTAIKIELNFTGVVVNKTVTTGSDLTQYKNFSGIRIFAVNTGGVLEGYELILEGDYTNVDIPYFEGMQSVKMPVLKTTGKNLFDKSKVKYNTTLNAFNGLEEENNLYMSSDFINVKPNKSYASNHMGVIFYYDENKSFIDAFDSPNLPQKFTTPNNCKYVRVRSWEQYSTIEKQREIVELEQLEEGTQATTYEPYKSNILTVNEPVELRGIGDVRDTLDCLTGEYTQAIYEYTFTGDEDWQIGGGDTGGYKYFIILNGQLPIRPNYNVNLNIPISCDRLPIITYTDFDNRLKSVGINLSHYFRLNFSDCNSNDGATVEDLKAYLKANPTTVQYPISKSVKTVDLSVTDQDGNQLSKIKPIEGTMHIKTDGSPIKPTFTSEIPVEAITQNLASFTGE